MVYATEDDLERWVEETVEELALTENEHNIPRKYFTKLLQNVRRSDESGIWMRYSIEGTICDEHLMNAGL